MKRLLLASVAVCACVCRAPIALAADTWIEERSPHFTVISDNGQRSTRDILQQFEQVRSAIHTLWPWANMDLDKPVLILAVKNEDGMKVLVPQAWEQKNVVRPGSMLVTGLDRHYIALRADVLTADKQGTVNPYINAYWSYSALIFRSGLKVSLPIWLTYGIAGVMSNINVTKSAIKVGEVIPWHIGTLHSVVERPRLSELVAVDSGSPWLTGTRRPMFDAVAWGFVHYLMFGEEGVHRPQLDRFITLLLSGKPSREALTQAFGDIDSFNSSFAVYLNRPIWSYGRVDADAVVGSENYPVRTLSVAEAASLRSAFHVATNRVADARATIDKLAVPAAHESVVSDTQGLLADVERKPDEARAAFAGAMEAGSTNFYTYYRWAALNLQAATTEEARAKIEQALTRASDLNVRFGPTQTMLALVKLQRGHAEDALPVAERAVALQPEDVASRMILIRALVASGRQDAAQREAANALPLATTDAQRQQLQQLANPPQRAAAAGGGVYQPGAGITIPKVVRSVTPSYTTDAMRKKIEGVVVVSCVVNTDGSVSDVKVVRSLDAEFGLDEEALKAARQWQFTPGTRQGDPVRVAITIEMSFTLKK